MEIKILATRDLLQCCHGVLGASSKMRRILICKKKVNHKAKFRGDFSFFSILKE